MFVRSRSSASSLACGVVPVVSMLLLAGVVAAGEKPNAKTSNELPPGGHSGTAFIATWDSDGDGKVSKSEYEAVRLERFKTTDSNSDGNLSVDEYLNEYLVRLDRQIADERKAAVGQTHTRFGSLDKNDDGYVSRAEYDASGDRAFTSLDTDKDGRILESEGKSAREERSPTRSVIRMPTSHTIAGLVLLYDDDGDGVVTRAEYDAQRTKSFAATDTNKDGKLDPTEYLNEFAVRLDRQIEDTRQSQLKQGRVRFKAIDADESSVISRDEYFAMSQRSFERLDTNKDAVVSADDPAPERRRRDDERSEAKRVSSR